MIEILTTLGIIASSNFQPVFEYVNMVDKQTDRTEEQQETKKKEEVVPQSVETTVEEYFKEDPIMVRIAWCETKIKHYEKDGTTVLRGTKTPKDIGVMQINEYYHGKTAEKLGINIHSLEGNLAYARYLYEREGTQPWKPSKHCWANPKLAIGK